MAKLFPPPATFCRTPQPKRDEAVEGAQQTLGRLAAHLETMV